ncbi:MAG: DUF1573 domain-containing protein [Planctomycetales bacterium]
MDVTETVSDFRRSPRFQVKAALPWIAAAIPFAAALLAHAVGPQPQPPADGPRKPALVVDQYLVNLGEARDDRFIVGRFGFRNGGEQPVEITALEPSCGCLQPQLLQRTYAPGEAGRFFLRVQAANEAPGPHEYFVEMKYTDPVPQSVRLTLKVVLPEQKVVLQPKSLMFYQLGTSETSQEIVVTDYRGRSLQPIDVESSSPDLARVEIAGVDEDDEGHRRIRLRVTAAARVPPGIHRAVISLRTEDPEHSLLQVPVVLQGPESGPRTASGERGGTGR